MGQRLVSKHYDVVVIGGGISGVAAAIAAAKNGAQTVLVEGSPNLGGLATSGLPFHGCYNSTGERIVGGVLSELMDRCRALGGYVDSIFDWRSTWIVCMDPEILKIVIVETLAHYNVSVLLYNFAGDVVSDGGRITGVIAMRKGHPTLISGNIFIDCSGDGDLATLAGAPSEKGSHTGELQPVSLIFRMGNVDFHPLLKFVRDNPDQILLKENPIITKTREECAFEVYKGGKPFTAVSAKGKLLKKAIESGRMFPCAAVFITPTSIERREVTINATRLSSVDATDTEAMGQALTTLTEQIKMFVKFAVNCLPGFQNAYPAHVDSRIGVRETRRIIGEYVLATEDVVEGRKFKDGIAKGGHHIDIHGSGNLQKRVPIKDGQSYDIPYGCLVPTQLKNVLIAGRCLSSTREANGSTRVMGTCIATSQAAGTAAALYMREQLSDVRDVSIHELRETLKTQGAILNGTR